MLAPGRPVRVTMAPPVPFWAQAAAVVLAVVPPAVGAANQQRQLSAPAQHTAMIMSDMSDTDN